MPVCYLCGCLWYCRQVWCYSERCNSLSMHDIADGKSDLPNGAPSPYGETWIQLIPAPKKKQLWIKIDYFIRWFLLIVLSLSAVSSFIFLTPFNQGWLAIKVLLFAGTIFCGIMIRISAKPYIKAFQKMLSEGSSPKLEKEINDSASTARIWVKMIWLLISIAAFIGIWQPTIF